MDPWKCCEGQRVGNKQTATAQALLMPFTSTPPVGARSKMLTAEVLVALFRFHNLWPVENAATRTIRPCEACRPHHIT